MLPSELTVDLSRLQFALTAMYHFLFVPLTLGLSWILVILEAAYLKTGKQVYRDMCRFWGKLFAINFAMGVVTGITMEFEFGQNWSYFSRFIGDSFGTALAIEGVTAFMTEATMFGLYFFTWDKVSKKTHFIITFFMALGTNLSIVNIIVANSWMQDPAATYLDYHTMTMHLTSFVEIYVRELAQIRIGHIVFAGLLTASSFVLGISAFYLLKKRDEGFALRSFAVAAGFGLASAVFVFFLGDANGLAIAEAEPAKMAAVEGQWETQAPPAAWYPIAFPNQAQEKNYGVIIKIPYALSLIATHSLTGTVEGMKSILQKNRVKLEHGASAYAALQRLRSGNGSAQDEATFDQYRNEIGYGFLLSRYTDHPEQASPQLLDQVNKQTIPNVAIPFWTFRIMLACWGLTLIVMLFSFVASANRTIQRRRWLMRFALWGIPLPYIAAEAGWVLAETGRQPWVVKGILPTTYGSSSLDPHTVAVSLAGFGIFYTILYVVMIYLMFRVARKGPSSLGTGRYHFETIVKSA